MPKVLKKGKYVPGAYKVRVGRSSAGLGLYAVDAIPKGKCIIEYKGRRISEAESYTSRSKYLFEINKKKTIDGTARSNIARYINHACKPNSEIEIYKERVYVFSMKNIKPGEELSYDYGEEYFNDYIKPFGCRCISCKKS